MQSLAHPLRMRLLGLLRMQGPSTATKLASQVGESSGLTSDHLRQLASVGMVTDADPSDLADVQPTGGRERWWKAAHQFTRSRAAPAGRRGHLGSARRLRADRDRPVLRQRAALVVGGAHLAGRLAGRHAVSDMTLSLTQKRPRSRRNCTTCWPATAGTNPARNRSRTPSSSRPSSRCSPTPTRSRPANESRETRHRHPQVQRPELVGDQADHALRVLQHAAHQQRRRWCGRPGGSAATARASRRR